jgi:hypothetical protein
MTQSGHCGETGADCRESKSRALEEKLDCVLERSDLSPVDKVNALLMLVELLPGGNDSAKEQLAALTSILFERLDPSDISGTRCKLRRDPVLHPQSGRLILLGTVSHQYRHTFHLVQPWDALASGCSEPP